VTLKIGLEQEEFMKLKLIHSSRDLTGKILEIKRHRSYLKLRMKKIAQDLMILKKKSLSILKKKAQMLVDQQLKRIRRDKRLTSQDTPIKKKLKTKKQN
jgi:hypothetical protein